MRFPVFLILLKLNFVLTFIILKKLLRITNFFFNFLSNKREKVLFFYQGNSLGFFTTVVLGTFIVDKLLFFFIVDCTFYVTNFFDTNGSSAVLSFTLKAFCCFFWGYFAFVLLLLYSKCYRFERAFFTLKRFLPYTSSPHLVL